MRVNTNPTAPLTYPPSGTQHIIRDVAASQKTISLAVADKNQFSSSQDGSDNVISVSSTASAITFNVEVGATGESYALTNVGFGTFTSNPYLHIIGWDTENSKLWIMCQTTGGSASFTAGNLYPLTLDLSARTATLGVGVTPPVVAGKAVQWHGNCVNNGILLQCYHDTTNFRMDTVRLYDISATTWSDPGTSPYGTDSTFALPSNVQTAFVMCGTAQSGKTLGGGFSGSTAPYKKLVTMFNFSDNSFTNKNTIMPDYWNNSDLMAWIVADPNGRYFILGFRNLGSTGFIVCVYDRVDDYAYVIDSGEVGNFFALSTGDEGNNWLCRNWYLSTTTYYSYRSLCVDYTGAGVLTGASFASAKVTSYIYSGYQNCTFVFKIDGGVAEIYSQTKVLWEADGYKTFMRSFQTSLRAFFMNNNNFNAEVPMGVPLLVYFSA